MIPNFAKGVTGGYIRDLGGSCAILTACPMQGDQMPTPGRNPARVTILLVAQPFYEES